MMIKMVINTGTVDLKMSSRYVAEVGQEEQIY
jgi:hypothetical protein